MVRHEKEAVVAALKEELADAQSVVLTEYRGLRAGPLGALRHHLRAQGVEFKVVKNKLLVRAMDAEGADWTSGLAGPTAIAYSREDAVTPAKLLAEAADEHQELVLKGALLDGRFLDADETTKLSKMPSHDELMAQIVGSLQSPLMGIIMTYQSIAGELIYTLKAYAEREDGDASA